MEDTLNHHNFAVFSRISGLFKTSKPNQPTAQSELIRSPEEAHRMTAFYTVTLRGGITTFDDAMAAAKGFKEGSQQILNLTGADIALKQKIVDFMTGVNYAQDGTWEEIGKDIYILAPQHAYVEVAPASPRMTTLHN